MLIAISALLVLAAIVAGGQYYEHRLAARGICPVCRGRGDDGMDSPAGLTSCHRCGATAD